MTDRNQLFDTARSPRRRIMPVDVDTARCRTVTSEVRATGRVEALNAVELKPDESGRVVALLFREGQQVDSGTPLVRIDADLLRALHTMDPQRAVIEVPERYAGELHIGQPIAFTVAAHEGRTFHAKVEFIDPVVPRPRAVAQ